MQRSIVHLTICVAFVVSLALLNVERTIALPEPQATPVSQQASLAQGQIDQLVSPVALYPDALLANVLIASTYPLDVVMAARWVHDNKAVNGNKLSEAVAEQSWDDSVKTLVYAPVVLEVMSKQIDWTNKLGEAFLAQEKDVFDAVQRLRKQAMEAGKLQSTAQQTVTVEDNTIYIEPAETTTMYVPYYDTNDAYGLWLWDDYPPYYWPAPPNDSVTKGFFAAAVIAGIWNGSINYPSHHLTINNKVEHFSRRSSSGGEVWRHNPSHRQGVTYSRPELQSQFGTAKVAGDAARRAFRGYSPPGGASLDRGGKWEDFRGSSDRSTSFDGIGRGNDTRGYSDRGYSSRTGSIGGYSGFRSGGMRGGGMRGGAARR